MHHKRKRRKNARSGCLLCKAQKANGVSHVHSLRISQRRRLDSDREKIRCEGLKLDH